MKHFLLFNFLSVCIISLGQSTAIPDANFEQALIDLNIDSDGLNGFILNSDAEQFIWQLDVSNKNIDDLTGIEAFVNLTGLDCSSNNLVSLNLSANTSLINVSANYNNLTEINLNNLDELQGLGVHDNLLDSLNLSNHPELYSLMCYRNNLTHLNISSNSNLVHLSCGENQLSGNLDISAMYDLEFFACRYNQLSSISSFYHPSVTIFNCQNNNFTELDLTNFFSLEQVYVDSNDLSVLNVKNGSNFLIEDFHAEGNSNLFCIQVDDAAISASDPNWIEDSQSSYSEVCDWLETDELLDISFTVWPNPVSDKLFIESDESELNEVKMVDIKGKLLLEKVNAGNATFIDISDFSKGTYFILIHSNDQIFRKKIMKF